MSATSCLLEDRRDFIADMKYVKYGLDYQRHIINTFGEKGGMIGLVCKGAIPMCITENSEPRDDYVGRNLVQAYAFDAYNAICDHHGSQTNLVQHCMFRTVGGHIYVVDFEDRVWSGQSAGAHMCLVASSRDRKVVVRTTNSILALEGGGRPIQKAFLDALLLPLVQNWAGNELSCETMMYVNTTFCVLRKHITRSDLNVIRRAISRVYGLDMHTDNTFSRNLLGVIAVQFGLPTPWYMSRGPSRACAIILGIGRSSEKNRMRAICLMYKLWIDQVNDREKSGLLIATFLDRYLEWGGGDSVLDQFANELLEDEASLPQPIDVAEVHHRGITLETVLGVSNIKEPMAVEGGQLIPAGFGEICTTDFSGRRVGTVDKRRAVAYFDDKGDIVLQFKNARNYFLNVLYYARPGKFVKTEVRDAVVDRDKLVGLPALHLLLRGRTNMTFARFIIAALTFGAISVKKRADDGIAAMFGTAEGKYDIKGVCSPSVLAAFPTVFDSEERLYLYHDGATYRAKCDGFQWTIAKEDMKEDPIGFGSLSSAFAIKGWSGDDE